jgi:hypothetical protein
MTDPLNELAEAWRTEAKTLRERYRDEARARMLEVCASELEERIHTILTASATLDEAAEMSGWSKRHIRRLMDNQELRNVGKPGAPRVLIAQLPMKKTAGVAQVIATVDYAITDDPGIAVADRIRRFGGSLGTNEE